MRNFLLGFLLILSSLSLTAQKSKVKLCLHDNPKLSPSNELVYYWWDPYHIHLDGKILDPDGVKKDYYLKSEPPYDYCFMLKAGQQKFKVVSLFNDSIQFDLNLTNDTTIIFQNYVKDYYKIASSSEKLLQNLKAGDKLTVHFSKNFNNVFEGLRIDLIVNKEGIPKVSAVNRKLVTPENDPTNYKFFNEAFNEIENAASLLKNPAEIGYTITIRKNRLVKEYRGKNEVAKIAQVFSKIKSSLNAKSPTK